MAEGNGEATSSRVGSLRPCPLRYIDFLASSAALLRHVGGYAFQHQLLCVSIGALSDADIPN